MDSDKVAVYQYDGDIPDWENEIEDLSQDGAKLILANDEEKAFG